VSAKRFGELMNASHASQRDDYEVSVPAVEYPGGDMQKTPGVGARLTVAVLGECKCSFVASRQAL